MKKKKHKKLILSFLATLCLVTAAFTDASSQERGLTDLISQARSAGIEQADISRLQNRAAERGISDEQLVRILRPAVEMAEQNLPADIVFQKAFEGIAKGIPAGRMIPVLEGLRGHSVQAASVIDPWMQREEVKSFIAKEGKRTETGFRNEMIRAGVKSVSLENQTRRIEQLLNAIDNSSVLDKTTPASVLAAVNIMPDLPESARRGEVMSSLISKALGNGFNAEEMQKLPVAMNAAQRRSQLPAATVMEGVSNQLQGGIPAEQILQNLFNGNVSAGPPGNIPRGLENRPDRGRGNGRN
ncbi:MAG TPA: hypothetical protein VKM36_07430 [Balneolaceae bacterium]|nr:hypothetical protein [Balneolaceae bacterium]